MTDHILAGTSEQKPGNVANATRTHDDHATFSRFGDNDDRLGRSAFNEFDVYLARNLSNSILRFVQNFFGIHRTSANCSL